MSFSQFFKMRFRNVFMVYGTLLTIMVWVLSDPDLGFVQNLPFGSSTAGTFIILLKSVIYVAALHLSRRALVDYLDLEEYFLKAKETAQGAGLATLAVGLIMVAIAIVILAAKL